MIIMKFKNFIILQICYNVTSLTKMCNSWHRIVLDPKIKFYNINEYYFNDVRRSTSTTCDTCYYTIIYHICKTWHNYYMIFWRDTRQPSREQRSSIIIVEVGPSSWQFTSLVIGSGHRVIFRLVYFRMSFINATATGSRKNKAHSVPR